MKSHNILATSFPLWVSGAGIALAIGVIGCANVPTNIGSTGSGHMTITSQLRELPPGGSTTLVLSDTRSVPPVVNWSLSCGTGTTSGPICGVLSGNVYTAPSSPPDGNQVTITASAKDGEVATLSITLDNPVPEIVSVSPSSIGSGASTLQITGHGFIKASTVEVQSGEASIANVTVVSPTMMNATITVPVYASGDVNVAIDNPSPGSSTSSPAQITIGNGTISYDAAVRFLRQATFGPTPELIAHVQKIGFGAFIDEQLSAAPSLYPWDEFDDADESPSLSCNMLYNAVNGPDQLRQRVSFALSQIIVASYIGSKVNINAMPTWENVLQRDALGTYPQMLKDALQSYAVGMWLDNVDNMVTGPDQRPNQNLGRELLQLFSIGPYRLNMDGSVQKDSNGNPIPSYSEDVVDGVSRAISGWQAEYLDGPQGQQQNAQPLRPTTWGHDESAKLLLNGYVSPAGQTAEQDLDTLVNSIASDQNIAPFISRRLIQSLVTSNPSPAYIERVARVFANDGTGTIGNLKAVVKAILLDPEARAGDLTPPEPDFGHLEEPFLYLAGILRATGTQIGNVGPPSTRYTCSADNEVVQGWLFNAGQLTFRAPSVLNFYQFNNRLAGSTLYAPEMQIMNVSTVYARMNFLNDLLFGSSALSRDGIQDQQWLEDAKQSPDALVADLTHYLMGETMDSSTAGAISSAVSAIPATEADARVRQAIYLIAASGQYQVVR